MNHAGVGPASMRVVRAVSAFMESLAHLGQVDFDEWEEIVRVCKARFARLVGAGPEEISLVRNTSHGLGMVAAGLDWRPGDRVAVAAALEYPSNVYPWLDLARRGVVALDEIEADRGAVTPERVERAMKPETRLVAVSAAQYGSGAVTDLSAIGSLCADRGALLCVDGIQTLGALPMDVRTSGIHFLSADSHKWMLGVSGMGGFYVAKEVMDQLRPVILGWRSTVNAFDFDRAHLELAPEAQRYEEGSLPIPLVAGFSAALEVLEELGIRRGEAIITARTEGLARRLEALGCVVGPDPAVRKHILSCLHPEATPEVMLAELGRRGIVASVRRGGLRLSPHFYNTEDDVEAVAEGVKASISA
ncbi:MAG: aminotransferase class V-fold PLP-dependent enzyme [Gemmatimonadetes bacterium]|nr:aminotransferase class V-fold PLP-dependent enzyme [Gemmatimonadota bacterium]